MDVCPPDIRLSHYLHSSLHCPSIHLSFSPTFILPPCTISLFPLPLSPSHSSMHSSHKGTPVIPSTCSLYSSVASHNISPYFKSIDPVVYQHIHLLLPPSSLLSTSQIKPLAYIQYTYKNQFICSRQDMCRNLRLWHWWRDFQVTAPQCIMSHDPQGRRQTTYQSNATQHTGMTVVLLLYSSLHFSFLSLQPHLPPDIRWSPFSMLIAPLLHA